MPPIIHTPCGEIRGTDSRFSGVTAYKGIRYATAERWKYPEPVTHWDGVYDASSYGNCCYQPRAFQPEDQISGKAFYYNEFRKGETYTYSEDCLFLNIWAPDQAKNLPVLLYIHGGAFTGGCGHEKHFEGPVWPEKGVIAVTINYRLGPLGFTCLPELEREAGHTGNYGLYDQLAAIRWIRENIRAFGGDPENITVMGQSAGAMSVQQLCLSPLTKGLIAKAVMSSGGGVGEQLGKTGRAEEMYGYWQEVMKTAGCETLESFRSLSPEELFRAWDVVNQDHKGMGLTCTPCIDGRLIPRSGAEAIQSGEFLDIPYMAGSTSDDIVPPVVFRMAKGWCRLQADQGRHPSYTWFFDRQLPGDDEGAWHSSDLWYWFGTLDNCWRPFTEKDRDLSREMTDYLTNFAKTGDPNGAGLPQWLPQQKGQNRVMRLGEKPTHMGGVNIAKLNQTMLTSHAAGE